MNDTPAQETQRSFYASALSAADRVLFDEARAVDGLAEEIALLRVRLRETLSAQGEDAKLIESGVRLLIQSLLAQHRLSPQQADNLSSAFSNVVEEFGNQLRAMPDV